VAECTRVGSDGKRRGNPPVHACTYISIHMYIYLCLHVYIIRYKTFSPDGLMTYHDVDDVDARGVAVLPGDAARGLARPDTTKTLRHKQASGRGSSQVPRSAKRRGRG
jgi:hypothetical protein